MWWYPAVTLPWVLVLLLLWALLAGQPAAYQQAQAQVDTQTTQLVALRATVQAYPTPTSGKRCYSGYGFVPC